MTLHVMLCVLAFVLVVQPVAGVGHHHSGRCMEASCESEIEDSLSLLQASFSVTSGTNTESMQHQVSPLDVGKAVDDVGNLTMAYIPFNFGHSVSAKAIEHGIMWGDCGSRFAAVAPKGCLGFIKSNVTGCDMKYTPGKYWPKDLADTYFGNNEIFGILRDPYERLVAQFRGSCMTNPFGEYCSSCDVNSAVNAMMTEYKTSLEGGDPYINNCNYLPQAEFFDGPFGATITVDNRLFPESANKVLAEHGYGALSMQVDEVQHVSGCDEKWAADLHDDTRELVKELYARDFDLLCTNLGYCDREENVCLTHVPGMCPPQLFDWNEQKLEWEPKVAA